MRTDNLLDRLELGIAAEGAAAPVAGDKGVLLGGSVGLNLTMPVRVREGDREGRKSPIQARVAFEDVALDELGAELRHALIDDRVDRHHMCPVMGRGEEGEGEEERKGEP